ncbi:MAG: glycosidase [Candidatus Sumerlaeota bacterium]|nr:glycosidase [Candidatus Sumerlaeota bacterium]
MLHFKRCPENPIVRPGLYPWRMATVFNPGVIYDEGKFYLYERAAGGLRPFHCYIGMLESADGVHFRHVQDTPVLTPEMAGSRYGSVQDPRVVKIEGLYYMTYAFRPYACGYHPTGLGVPDTEQMDYPGFSKKAEENQTRSGIAISKDRIHWEHLCWPTPAELDDRDVILFPEKIGGRFALLRRPLQFIGPKYGTDMPGIWICFSEDLRNWSEPELIAKPEYKWEDGRIGGSTPPIRTDKGWLVLYHGVEMQNAQTRRVVYRLGAMMLDLEDPRKVLARTPDFIMEPEEYYEHFGLFIPHVIFPTGAVVKDELLWLYYGVADTAIALATISLNELVDYTLHEGRIK